MCSESARKAVCYLQGNNPVWHSIYREESVFVAEQVMLITEDYNYNYNYNYNSSAPSGSVAVTLCLTVETL